MEGEKKHVCACGGTCGCGQHSEEVAPNEGETMAREAIEAMTKPKEEELPKADDNIDAAVDGFLKACSDAEQDPMEVVAHIAKSEELEISGDAPEDAGKRRTYDLLRAVVARLVTDLSESLADECGFDTDPIASLVLKTMSLCRRVPQNRRSLVRIFPMRVRYAVSF